MVRKKDTAKRGDSGEGEGKKRSYRYHPGTVALREIRHEQKISGEKPAISKAKIVRYVLICFKMFQSDLHPDKKR